MKVFNDVVVARPPQLAEQSEDFEITDFCTKHHVYDYVKHLRAGAAEGFDKISPRFLKLLKFEIADCLSFAINRCLSENCYPKEFKVARLVPVPKVNCPTSCTEYRPISVLSAVSKIFEQHIQRITYQYIAGPLDNMQFGFRRFRGTEDALAAFQCFVHSSFTQSKSNTRIACVSLDAAKAFDKVVYYQLLDKCLNSYNVPLRYIKYLEQYLIGRTMQIQFEDSLGEPLSIPSGVPQGSILGPGLYNLYANCILELQLSPNCKVISYADDMLVLKPIFCDRDFDDFQMDLEKIHQEYANIHMGLNTSKCAALLLSWAPRAPIFPKPFILGGEQIPIVDNFKYLGVIVDRKCFFDLHWERKVVSVRQLIFVFWQRYLKHIDRSVFRFLYENQIRPVLLYACNVIMPVSKNSILKVEKVNLLALRMYSGSYTQSAVSLCEQYNWQSVSELGFQRSMMLCYKYVHHLRDFPLDIGLISVRGSLSANLRSSVSHCNQLSICENIFEQTGALRHRKNNLSLFCMLKIWNLCTFEESNLSLPLFQAFIKNVVTYHDFVLRAKPVIVSGIHLFYLENVIASL